MNGRMFPLFGLPRVVAAAAIGVIGLGLGGCNNKQKQADLTIADLQAENTTLRDENEKLNASLGQATERVQSLESENSTLKSAPPPAAQPVTTDTGASASRDRILTIAGDVAFAPGSATLTSAGRREVDKVISLIKNQYGGNRIEIAGYTDTTPLQKSKPKWQDNENLSAQRALAVERYMNSKGIPDELTHSAAYGPAAPKGSKKDSRRVEIKILAN